MMDDLIVIGQILSFMIVLFGAYVALIYADSINPKLDESSSAPQESGAASDGTEHHAVHERGDATLGGAQLRPGAHGDADPGSMPA